MTLFVQTFLLSEKIEKKNHRAFLMKQKNPKPSALKESFIVSVWGSY